MNVYILFWSIYCRKNTIADQKQHDNAYKYKYKQPPRPK